MRSLHHSFIKIKDSSFSPLIGVCSFPKLGVIQMVDVGARCLYQAHLILVFGIRMAMDPLLFGQKGGSNCEPTLNSLKASAADASGVSPVILEKIRPT